MGFLLPLVACHGENRSGHGSEKRGTGLGRPLASAAAGQHVLVVLVATSPRAAPYSQLGVTSPKGRNFTLGF